MPYGRDGDCPWRFRHHLNFPFSNFGWNHREILGKTGFCKHFVASLSFVTVSCTPVSRKCSVFTECSLPWFQSTIRLYRPSQICTSGNAWALGNCTGPTQRHWLFWRQRDKPALAKGEEASRESLYCDYCMASVAREGGTVETWHLQDQELPGDGGSQALASATC